MEPQVGVGFSRLAAAIEAGRGATEEALQPLAGREPDLVVLFSTSDLEPGQVLAGVRAVAGDVPLIGACSTGIIVSQGAFSTGVAVLALQSERIQVLSGVAPGVGRDPTGVSRALVRRLWAGREAVHEGWNALLLALIGNLAGREVTAVQAIGDELGPACQLIGGGAQDPSGRISECLLLNHEAYDEAVAAALLLTPGPVGVGIRHGYEPLGRPLVVTRAEGNILYELDGRSAFQAYVEQFPDHPELTLESFGPFALDYPLGLPQMGREYIVRDPFGARPDGALECAGVIPEHAVVRIMRGNRETLIGSAREAAAQAMRSLGGRRPLLAMAFSCVSRLAYLGPGAQEEVAAIREVIGPTTPLIGLFSFGEVAAQPDSPATLHNKSAVVGVIAEQ